MGGFEPEKVRPLYPAPRKKLGLLQQDQQRQSGMRLTPCKRRHPAEYLHGRDQRHGRGCRGNHDGGQGKRRAGHGTRKQSGTGSHRAGNHRPAERGTVIALVTRLFL